RLRNGSVGLQGSRNCCNRLVLPWLILPQAPDPPDESQDEHDAVSVKNTIAKVEDVLGFCHCLGMRGFPNDLRDGFRDELRKRDGGEPDHDALDVRFPSSMKAGAEENNHDAEQDCFYIEEQAGFERNELQQLEV